ncbi:MAG: FAD:protein FMN transferase [Microbacterium sp.]|uniref:FAD:protein FMN transferase n=1 Tax=Microbacterium sp. TaxID=51671 RepID=UPI001AC58EF4|nr:FAD:protein FMN transferase [Microbacterium sp.]MBN9175876.1 FAD:protein FMN transferase [Microbacterium sp.]
MDAAVASARTFTAIGTRWQIDTATPLSAEVSAEIDDVIDRFDREWSRFRDDSVVSALARSGGAVPAPADARAMLDLYAELAASTAGAVNPLVGDALARRGYDARISLEDRGAQSARSDWQDLLTWTNGELRLADPATIDVGALGKGRLVDLVGEVLAARTGAPFVVDASGDILMGHGGDGEGSERARPERIGLEHPYDPRRAIGVWEVAGGALCASATNRRAWTGHDGAGLHHVLDARTGEPVREIAATWAFAADAMTADAAATALFFAGGEAFAAAHDVQWVRMTTPGRVEWSRGCTAELFT